MSLLIGMLACTALVGCTSEDSLENGVNNDQKNGKEYYAVVNFSMPGNTTSRAASLTGYVNGTTDEVKVNNVNFFFLNAEGKSVADAYYVAENKATNFNAWADPDGESNSKDMLSQAIVVMKNPTEIPTSIVAVINTGDLSSKFATKRPNLADIQGLSDNFATETYTGLPMTKETKDETTVDVGNLVMTSTSYMNANGELVIGAPVSASNIFESNSALQKAIADAALSEIPDKYAVIIPVEKVLAKVTVSTVEGGVTIVTDTQTDKSTANVGKLTTLGDDGITVTGDQETTLSVRIDGWWLDSTPKKSWLLKKLDLTFAGSWWNDIANTRSYWANSYAESDQAYANFIYEDEDDKVLADLDASLYCQENTGNVDNIDQATDDAADGADNVYDVNNRTKVVVAATLMNGEKPIDLVKWYGNYYTKEAFMVAFANLNDVKKYYVVDAGNSTEDKTVYRPLAVSDLVMVYNTDKDDIVNGAEIGTNDQNNIEVDGDDIRNYEAAVELASTVTAVYTDINGTLKNINELVDTEDYINTIDEVKAELRKISKVLYWNAGRTYYYVEIEHNNDNSATGAEFGVVRNHLYKLELEKINGLGTPVPNPDKIIIPEKRIDSYSETYISARIQILSYRIVEQNGIELK